MPALAACENPGLRTVEISFMYSRRPVLHLPRPPAPPRCRASDIHPKLLPFASLGPLPTKYTHSHFPIISDIWLSVGSWGSSQRVAYALVRFPGCALAILRAVPCQAAASTVAQLGGLPALVAGIAAEHGPELAAHLSIGFYVGWGEGGSEYWNGFFSHGHWARKLQVIS